MSVAANDANAPLWTAEAAALSTGGLSILPWKATGVSIDSRSVKPGDLFVALRGPNFDGHEFVNRAFAAGAAAAMIDRTIDADGPVLTVLDTFAGLGDLARGARERTDAKFIAVTGSVGKTSTKEALATVLALQGPTHASAGNLNNHWGLPLSLARMPQTTRFGVFELGMNHANEIAPLSKIARPHVAMVTNVEPAHLGNFRDLDEVADAKAEIFVGIEPGGAAVLNRDNGMYVRLRDAARAANVANIFSFGTDPGADARLLDADITASGSVARAELMGRKLEFQLAVPGRHQLLNALGVLLAVEALGLDSALVAGDLQKIKPVAGRGARFAVPVKGGTVTVIDESYNASPASMAAALSVLGLEQPAGSQGRRIAVLGDMLELGEQSGQMHANLLADLADANVDLVFACGEHVRWLIDAMPPDMRAWHTTDATTLAPIVAEAMLPGDVVLVKGSLGIGMKKVVEALIQLGRPTEATKKGEV